MLDRTRSVARFAFITLAGAALLTGGCTPVAPNAGTSTAATSTTTGAMPVQTNEPLLVIRPYTHNGAPRHLATWYPPGYFDPANAAKRWPLIVFLHGRGECGTEGSKQTAQGLVAAAQLNAAGWPAVIIAPQKQAGDGQWVQDQGYVMACLDSTLATERVNPNRVYLTGLSQGGAGTWAIAANKPDRFAAIAPICGYGDPAPIAAKLTAMPIWAFHGLKDDVVPPAQSEAMVAAIQAARTDTGKPGGADADPAGPGVNVKGPKPKLTLLPDANHNSWDTAYRATGADSLWTWMSGFSK